MSSNLDQLLGVPILLSLATKATTKSPNTKLPRVGFTRFYDHVQQSP